MSIHIQQTGNAACEQGEGCPDTPAVEALKYRKETFTFQKTCPVGGGPTVYRYTNAEFQNTDVSGLSSNDMIDGGKNAKFKVLTYPPSNPVNVGPINCEPEGGARTFGPLVENAICEQYRTCINGNDICDAQKEAQSPGSGTCWALRDQVNNCGGPVNFCANQCVPACTEPGGGAMKPRLRQTPGVGGRDTPCQNSKRQFMDTDGNGVVTSQEAVAKVKKEAEKFIQTDCLRTIDKYVRNSFEHKQSTIRKCAINVKVTVEGTCRCVMDDEDKTFNISGIGIKKIDAEDFATVITKPILKNGPELKDWNIRNSGGRGNPNNQGCLTRFEIVPYPKVGGKVLYGWPCYNTAAFPQQGQPSMMPPYEVGDGTWRICMFAPSSLALRDVLPPTFTAEHGDKWSSLSIREIDTCYDITDCVSGAGNVNWAQVNNKISNSSLYTPLANFRCVQNTIAFQIKGAAGEALSSALDDLDRKYQQSLAANCQNCCAQAKEVVNATGTITFLGCG